MEFKKLTNPKIMSPFDESLKILFLKNEDDFNKMSEKVDDNHLFEYELFLKDSEGKEKCVIEHYYAYNKELNIFFGFEKMLISEQELDELDKMFKNEVGEINENLEQKLAKIDITKETLHQFMLDYITKEKPLSRNFTSEDSFTLKLFAKFPRLREIYAVNQIECDRLFEELIITKGLDELISKNEEQENVKKEAIINELITELPNDSDYLELKNATSRNAFIKNKLEEKYDTEWYLKDIMLVRGKTDLLIAKNDLKRK